MCFNLIIWNLLYPPYFIYFKILYILILYILYILKYFHNYKETVKKL